jgi:hypothetical protein
MASDGTHATIMASESGKQMYASTSIDQVDESSYFSIVPTDQSGKKFELVSKAGMRPCFPQKTASN